MSCSCIHVKFNKINKLLNNYYYLENINNCNEYNKCEYCNALINDEKNKKYYYLNAIDKKNKYYHLECIIDKYNDYLDVNNNDCIYCNKNDLNIIDLIQSKISNFFINKTNIDKSILSIIKDLNVNNKTLINNNYLNTLINELTTYIIDKNEKCINNIVIKILNNNEKNLIDLFNEKNKKENIIDDTLYMQLINEKYLKINKKVNILKNKYNKEINIQLFIILSKLNEMLYNDILKFIDENNIEILTELNKNICIICLNVLNTNNTRKLKCKHEFHIECINKWILRSKSCPICRCMI